MTDASATPQGAPSADAQGGAAAPPSAPLALIVVDVQGDPGGSSPGIAHTDGKAVRYQRVLDLVATARANHVPVVFIQEVHKPSLVDIGRELDGAEGVHCVEGEPSTELAPDLVPGPDEFLIRKRRYSAFFATELDLVLRSHGIRTVVLVGGLTDVCIHYTAVDAHQHDYHLRVVADAVGGSSVPAHDAALRAIEYLQRDALTTTAAMKDAFAAQPGVPLGRRAADGADEARA
ncbi:isochorismatase family cysteine hydrolase [Conexibacter sp. JD483]|uniref:cysteine hydrolase family protein n=1 Tax=unclassified Conexibacter TaxID=2627773 RepID=UPI00272698F1|nr:MULTISPECIES: isochorismatase family cysteine hydrolase [unclassified Conexibacter]MDO8188490.1 isochorismatase family cysteine hydrolase [Conexibacter sp. CPCC 205706]MDO8201434.1 isochorismatase family cysteine hydrolase [Conexibacter sp. CPCC 205762]MDR9372883.1 isochorismatase family cysteine hydrolase [Conexibacter sp. JD483]